MRAIPCEAFPLMALAGAFLAGGGSVVLLSLAADAVMRWRHRGVR